MKIGNFYPCSLLRTATLLLCFFAITYGAYSQCTNSSSYGSGAVNTGGSIVTISTCSYAGEYSIVSGAVAGQTLRFTSSTPTDVITVRSGSSTGPVLAFGTTPLTFVNSFTGTVYPHWNTPGCGSESLCRTTTVQCTSCAAPPPTPCTNATSYGTATINTTGAVVTISTCSYGGEYSTVSGAVAGQTLRFTSSVTSDWITVHSGSSTGPVLAYGVTPLTFANSFTGVVYPSWNTPGCGSESACRTTTVQCYSCAIDPCNPTNIGATSCATPTTVSLTGAGLWSPGTCGFTTNGQEKIFTFTAPTSGIYTFQVTSASGGYIDYMYKPVTAGCSSTGWTCIHDMGSATSYSFGPLVAGTQYYILADEEPTTAVIHTFQINCPVPALSITCPPAATATCASTVPLPNVALVTGTTNCGLTAIVVTFLSDAVSNLTCTNRYTITRTYRATDQCGNVATCTQLITVNDNVAPTIISCPAPVTVSCVANIPASNPASVSATDNCNGTVTYSFMSDVISNQTCTNRYTLTRTYRATDACGNSSTCAQLITVNDVTAPTITCPANITVSCASNVPVANAANLTATDGCAGTVTKSFVSDVISSQTCANRYIITRTYRATDACGNTANCSHLITVNDQTAPVISGVPANITINCNQPVPNPPLVTVVDNCGGNATTTYNQVSSQSPWLQLCEAYSYNITRTWVSTDVCGNSTSRVQIITVRDVTAPTWVSVPPANITVECNEDDVNNVDPVPADACDPNPSLLFSFYYIPYLNGCVNSYTVVNTWTAGDKCGNTKQYVQHIYVVDTEPPVIKCPANISLFSVLPISVTWPLPTADDFCDGVLVPVQTSGPHNGAIFQPGTSTTITYTATDGCGNKSTCSFLVNIKNTIGKEGIVDNTPIHQSEEKIALYQNNPNPFESSTRILFSLPQDQEASIRIFGLDGKIIKVFSGEFNKGTNEVIVQEADLPCSGMYFYEMRSNGFIETKKMFYVK